MRDLWNTLNTVAFGLGVIVVVLLLVLRIRVVLPGRWAERGKVMVFLMPALFVIFIGLLVPAGRTIYRSFYVDKESRSSTGSRTTARSSPAGTPA